MSSQERDINNHEPDTGLKDLVKIDSVIHNPVRLAILFFLLSRYKESFTVIQNVLGLTAGNLSSHLKKLESKGLVVIEKTFHDAKPITFIYLTSEGKNTLLKYVDTMSQVLKKVKEED